MRRSVHQATGKSTRELFDFAEAFGNELQAYTAGKLDTDRLTTALVFRIRKGILPRRDLLIARSEEDIEVLLPPTTTKTHDRYEIAKAAGHWVLHTDTDQQQAIFDQNEPGEVGREAHDFALGLLVPRSYLEGMLTDEGAPDPAALSRRFDLPVTYAQQRLGLVAMQHAASV